MKWQMLLFSGMVLKVLSGAWYMVVGAPNGYIINVWDSVLGNLQLKDMCNIIVVYGYCICPTHQGFGQAECAVWCLKCGVVTRGFGKHAFIVAYI